VFFGFTNCPDICPTTLALLASAQKKAAVPGLKVALISVDPERDTPEQLGRYVNSFGSEFIGLTGDAPGIVKVTRAFGVASARVDLPGGGYTMDHSATVFALDSQARIVAIFTPPWSVPALTRDMERLRALLNVSSCARIPAPRAAPSSRFSTCCHNTGFRAWCSPPRDRARPRSRTRSSACSSADSNPT
jgi:hypothetical protein